MVPKGDSLSPSKSKLSSSSTSKKNKTAPSVAESCPSFRRGHLPNDEDVKRLRSLTRPHVESYNYFLDIGLAKGIKDIEPVELDLVDPKQVRDDPKSIDWDEVSTIQYWVEDIKVSKPVKSSVSGRGGRLYPHECRERSLMYSGLMTGKFCYNIIQRRNGVAIATPPTKIAKSFGNIPIMVGSKACHLHGLMPNELVKVREEVRILFYL
jgi:DNA-directed RNA polymerase I subunit RPA2